MTGGSRGIGKATVLALAQAGADVAINYNCSADAANQVCREAQQYDVRAQVYKANVAEENETTQMVNAMLDDFGTIDILVNNAGITRDKTFLKMTRSIWDEVLGVNLTRRVQRHSRRAAGHGRSGLGPRDQHFLDRRPDRQFRPDQLRGDQRGAHRVSP